MKAPWELDQPWFMITSFLAGLLFTLLLIILIEVLA